MGNKEKPGTHISLGPEADAMFEEGVIKAGESKRMISEVQADIDAILNELNPPTEKPVFQSTEEKMELLRLSVDRKILIRIRPDNPPFTVTIDELDEKTQMLKYTVTRGYKPVVAKISCYVASLHEVIPLSEIPSSFD